MSGTARRSLRIAMLNTTYGPGGASQIVANLANGLRHRGHACTSLVQRNTVKDAAHVQVLPAPGALAVRAARHLLWRFGLNQNGIPSSHALPRHPAIRDADVINVHNLHGGYFDFLALPRLSAHRPVVWTLHDMWAFTGHCVYAGDCDRWQRHCGRCPYPDAHEPVRADATALELWLKRWSYQRSNLHLIAVSRWMGRQVAASVLGEHPVHVIPNGIDLDRWTPIPRVEARSRLGLPRDRLIIAFVAAAVSDPRKGFDRLLAALEALPDALRARTELLIVGQADGIRTAALPLVARALGFIDEEGLKRTVYAAADLLAFPSRSDNLPVVLQEGLASGLPTVAFDTGGVGELVRNDETGLVASDGDVAGFAALLRRMLEDAPLRERLSHGATALARREYSLEHQMNRYLSVFEALSEQGPARTGSAR